MIFIGKTAEDFETKWDEISLTERPIVVWGSTEIAQMALAALDTLENKIIAVGDNNIDKQGKIFCGYKICSADEIIQKYSNAIIIVSVLLERTARIIINQLSEKNPKFDFYYPGFVEFIFETKILNRDLSEKRYIAKAAYNRVDDENNIIISKHDPGVLTYYNYYDYDTSNQLDLYNEIARISRSVPAIKRLDIHVNSENMDIEKAILLKQVAKLDNILHIYLIIDDECDFNFNVLDIICDVICSVKVITNNPHSLLIQALENRKINFEIYNPIISQDKKRKYQLCSETVTIRVILKEIETQTGIHSSYLESKENILDAPVSIMWLGSGLGNQIAIYLFAKEFEEKMKTNLIFDDISPTVFFLLHQNEDFLHIFSQIYRENKIIFDIDKLKELNIKTNNIGAIYYPNGEIFSISNASHNCISHYYSQDQWFQICFKLRKDELPLLSILSKKYRYKLFTDSWFYSYNVETMNLYKIENYQKKQNDNLLSCLYTNSFTNCYFFGMFSSIGFSDWLINESDWCRNQLKLIDIQANDEKNNNYLNKIRNCASVGIHIRRGDYACLGYGFENEKMFRSYFNNAITNIRKLSKPNKLIFFIFSDEPDWCMDNADMFGIDLSIDNVTFVSDNKKENSYKDMVLLSNCEYIVPFKGSSFSYCAIVLSSSCKYYADPYLYARYFNSYIPDNEINCLKKKK